MTGDDRVGPAGSCGFCQRSNTPPMTTNTNSPRVADSIFPKKSCSLQFRASHNALSENKFATNMKTGFPLTAPDAGTGFCVHETCIPTIAPGGPRISHGRTIGCQIAPGRRGRRLRLSVAFSGLRGERGVGRATAFEGCATDCAQMMTTPNREGSRRVLPRDKPWGRLRPTALALTPWA